MPSSDKMQLDRLQPSLMKFINEKSVRLISGHQRQWWIDFFDNVDVQFLSTPIDPPSENFMLFKLFDVTEVEQQVQQIDEDLLHLDQLINDPPVEVYK